MICYTVCRCEHEHMTDIFLFQALIRHEASVTLQENPIFGGLLRIKCSKIEFLAELQRFVQLSDTQLNTFTFFLQP